MPYTKNFYMQTTPARDDFFGFGETDRTYEERQKDDQYSKARHLAQSLGGAWGDFSFWKDQTVIDRKKGQDKPVHKDLNSVPGIKQLPDEKTGRLTETFEIDKSMGHTLESVRDYITNKFFSEQGPEYRDFTPRYYQTDFVKKANIEYSEFLLAAKCRAGKTTMSLLHIVDKGDDVAMVVSFRKSPEKGWFKDVSSLRPFANLRIVNMSDDNWKKQLKKYMDTDGIQVVLWSTVQGLNNKYKTLSNITTPDRIVFDECHIGDNATLMNTITKHFDGVPVLKASGTAFDQIYNTAEQYTYTYGYFEEQLDVKKGLFKDDDHRPKMKMVVAKYQSDKYSAVYGDDADKFSNMFLINEETGDFEDRSLVMDFIINIFDTNRNLKRKDTLLKDSRHIVLSLPSKRACYLFSEMINEKNVGGYYAMDISSNNSKADEDSINKFVEEKVMGGAKSICVTISANVLGVTCKEWDTVMHCRGGHSIKDWIQLSFRAGSGKHDWTVIDFNNNISLYSIRDMFSQAKDNNPELSEYTIGDFTPIVEWQNGFSVMTEDRINEVMSANVSNASSILSGLSAVLDKQCLVNYDFDGTDGSPTYTKNTNLNDESTNNDSAKERTSPKDKSEKSDFESKKKRVEYILSSFAKLIHYGLICGEDIDTLSSVLSHPQYSVITGDDINLIQQFIDNGDLNAAVQNRRIQSVFPSLKTKFLKDPDGLFSELFRSEGIHMSIPPTLFDNMLNKKVGDVIMILGDPDGFHTSKVLSLGYKPKNVWVWDNTNCGKLFIDAHKVNYVSDPFALSDMKFDVVIGNPPYGNRGSLAVQFLNKSLELSDDVRMILPLSFTKPSITNQVSLNHTCVSEEELSDSTFPNGIRAVYQRWVPSDTYRQKVILPTSHPDFEFVRYEERFDADLMIGAVGSGPSGRVKTENFTHYQPKHHFIKCKSEEIKNRMISLEPVLRTLSKQQNGRGGVSKSDIVTHYVNTLECDS